MPESRNKVQNAQGACCLWLIIGFTGAVMVAIGLLRWFDGDAGWQPTLTRIFSGVALASASWRCARTALDHARQAPIRGAEAVGELTMRALPPPIGAQTP